MKIIIKKPIFKMDGSGKLETGTILDLDTMPYSEKEFYKAKVGGDFVEEYKIKPTTQTTTKNNNKKSEE